MNSQSALPIFLLATISIALFLHGFFPIPQSNQKLDNNFPESFANHTFNKSIHDSQFAKTVLIVIDAIRFDFVDENVMPFLSKMANKSGCINKILVESPTVTLPRIKALITGSVPQFVDIITNLASAKTLEDSLIHSAIDSGKRVVFYGDDTWLKLFPSSFHRSEGTTSFYVKDFTEVDNNVTRNVDFELNRNDWDFMVLHYLGLDHIGHVLGPFSPLIASKLKEMDLVVEKVYKKLSNGDNKFLLLITGDHGMRDSGGHGGSTFPERNVPFVVIGTNCTNNSFLQTDIPVNLAVLLGIKIPSSSIGKLQPSLLENISLDTYLYYLMYNTLILNKKGTCEEFSFASSNYSKYLKTGDKKFALRAGKLYENCSLAISNYLFYSSSKQNLYSLIIAMLSLANLLIILLRNVFSNYRDLFQFITLFAINLAQFFLWNYLSIIFIAILTIFIIYNLNLIYIKCRSKYFEEIAPFLIVLLSFIIIHPLTFVSSSFVEEEHQFWYFTLNFVIFLNMIAQYNNGNTSGFLNFLLLSAGLRFLRTINQTGDKWANCPDFSDWLLKTKNLYYFHIFFLTGLISIAICLLLSVKNQLNLYVNYIILTSIFMFKFFDAKNVLIPRLIWILIILNNLLIKRNFKVCWLLILAFLLKPFNLLLISYCFWASKTFSQLFRNNLNLLVFAHLSLGNALYFAQGHSNSFASVDISVGYTALNSYVPVFVILQVLCHTYAFPVFCNVLLFSNCLSARKESDKVWILLFLNRIYVTLTTCIIIFIQRHHLFIWSVFAPKLFIEASHSAFLLVQIVIYSVIQRKLY